MLRTQAFRGAVLSLALLGLWDAAAHAQTSSPPQMPGPVSVLKEAVKDLAALLSLESLAILRSGAAAAAAVHPADRHLNRQLSGADYRFLTPGHVLGNAAIQGGGALATYIVGRASGPDALARRIGQQLVRAQLMTQATTLAVKVAVRRRRPDGGRFSFPSGHASTTFATATILDGHFGWRVSVPT